jgi:hypothetical protein
MVTSLLSLKIEDVTGSAFLLPQCALPPPSGNRWLYSNKLTSLEVGIFDKNTALRVLYVDSSAKGRNISEGVAVASWGRSWKALSQA